MSDFNFHDLLQGLRYILRNKGYRFVSIEIEDTDDFEDPKYTFVYSKNGTMKFEYHKMTGELDELIMGEIKRLQDERIK